MENVPSGIINSVKAWKYQASTSIPKYFIAGECNALAVDSTNHIMWIEKESTQIQDFIYDNASKIISIVPFLFSSNENFNEWISKTSKYPLIKFMFKVTKHLFYSAHNELKTRTLIP